MKGAPVQQSPFLTGITRMYENTKKSGTVYITMKQFGGVNTRAAKAAGHDGEQQCLIRARCGKKKISTIIGMKDVVRFQIELSTVIKGSIDGLKKKTRDRGSRKKPAAS